jgi:sec-independent protein translocase protein TatA
MPSWIGPWEMAIVLVLALLIFGPKKLPDLGKSLGTSIRGFRQGLNETKEDVTAAIKEETPAPEAKVEATASPAEAPEVEATAAQAEAPKVETTEKS